MIEPVQMQFFILHIPSRYACKPYHEYYEQDSRKNPEDCYASSIRSVLFIHDILRMKIILNRIRGINPYRIYKIFSAYRILDRIPPLRRIRVFKI